MSGKIFNDTLTRNKLHCLIFQYELHKGFEMTRFLFNFSLILASPYPYVSFYPLFSGDSLF